MGVLGYLYIQLAAALSFLSSDFTLSSRNRCEQRILENFVKFTRKQLYETLFFDKVEYLRPATLLKKRLRQWCFLVKLAKFLTGDCL